MYANLHSVFALSTMPLFLRHNYQEEIPVLNILIEVLNFYILALLSRVSVPSHALFSLNRHQRSENR